MSRTIKIHVQSLSVPVSISGILLCLILNHTCAKSLETCDWTKAFRTNAFTFSSFIFRGEWKFGIQWLLGQDLQESTIGIVGFGGIGQATAKRLKAFDVSHILYSGNSEKPQGNKHPIMSVCLFLF